MKSPNSFCAWTSHEQTWTHKTHHDLELKEATTFSLIILFVSSHRANTQMSFVSKLPSGSLEILEFETPVTLEAHNFVCKL